MKRVLFILIIAISFLGCGASVVEIGDANSSVNGADTTTQNSQTTTQSKTPEQELKDVTDQLNGNVVVKQSDANTTTDDVSSDTNVTKNQEENTNDANSTQTDSQTEVLENVAPIVPDEVQTTSSVPVIPAAIFELGK